MRKKYRSLYKYHKDKDKHSKLKEEIGELHSKLVKEAVAVFRWFLEDLVEVKEEG